MSLAEDRATARGRAGAARDIPGAAAAPIASATPEGPRLPPSLSRDLWLVWLLREDVRGVGTEWDEERGRRFLLWWLIHGRHEYPGVAPPSPAEIARAFALVPVHAGSRLIELPWILAELWTMRADLRAQFGPGEADLENLLRRFYVSLVREHRLFDILPPEHFEFVREPEAESGFRPLPVTRLMRWVWELRPDLRGAFPLASAAGRSRLVAWFYLFGAVELDLLPYVGEAERGALAQPLGRQSPVRLADRLAASYFAGDAGRPAGDAAVHEARRWVEGDPAAAPLRRLLAGEKAQARPPAAPSIGRPQRRDGVNLIGYPRGQFGLGEDIRMAAAALAAAEVPFSVIAMREHSDWRHHDPALDEHIAEDAPYAVNLHCGPGFETAGWRLQLGEGLWQGRRTIGWWPWELPRWPAAWRPAFELVDEVWAATRYARDAYMPDCPVPVTLMPPAVAVDRIEPRSRASLGLPDRDFLFALVFDGSSTLARKNPQAAVAAFGEAFPRGDEPVGLVMKGMNGAAAAGWRDLAAACAADPRILLFDEIWPREDVLALIAACDAFVSLHRAEGFGRPLAEAMLLEKPVIATAFSGNTDFLSAATGFPVRWAPRRLRAHEYSFGEGQFWAEPDIAAAAEHMRRIAADPAAARPIARAGRDFIAEHFSPAAAGRHIRRRLRELGLEMSDR